MVSDGREFFEVDHLVEIWGKPSCSYCFRTKAMSEKLGLNYIYYQLDEDFTSEEFLEKFPTAKTNFASGPDVKIFPQVVLDGKYIGGYMDYRNFLNETL